MKNRWTERVFVDVLAGPGRCYLKDRPQVEFDGSPLLAVQGSTTFTKAIFIENHQASASALEERLRRSGNESTEVLLIRGDCNSDAAVADVRRALKGPGVLRLVFVDTLGLTDVPMKTLRQMTAGMRADLIFTFQVNDAIRNFSRAMTQPHEAARFDRAFETDDWRFVLDAHRSGSALTVNDADAFTTFFETRLRSLGYLHTLQLHSFMKNSKNAPLYRLVFASHHDRGKDFWQKATLAAFDGSRKLF